MELYHLFIVSIFLYVLLRYVRKIIKFMNFLNSERKFKQGNTQPNCILDLK